MMNCSKCQVSVRGTAQRCPLCQGDLKGEENAREQVFPHIKPQKSKRLFLSVMGFISVAVGAICFAINLSFPTKWWSLFVIAGILSFWVSFSAVIRKRGNIHKTIVWQVVLLSIIAIAWDVGTGFHNWSIDFVIPIVCTAAMITMAAVGKIRKLKVVDYMIYLIIDSVLGAASLILLLCGAVQVVLPSALCIAASVISLGALFIFEGKAMRSELKRRMHL